MSTSAISKNYYSLHALLGSGEDLMRGKGEQRGSVRRRNGHWHISFYAWTTNSKGEFGYWPREKRISNSEKMSKRQAQQAGYDEFVAPANGPAKCAQSQSTLQQFIDVRFRPDHLSIGRKKTGKAFYESILKVHILPGLGSVKLADVSTPMIQSLIAAKCEAGLSTGTVRHIRNVLSAIFKHAKMLKFYHGDPPTIGVRLPEMVYRERGALTAQQVELLTAEMPEKFRPLVTVLAQTGLRIGEALGLRWKNVNLEDEWKISGNQAIPPNSLFICEAWVRGEYSTLKTPTSRRIVPLTSAAWVALMLHRDGSKARGDDNPVFASRAGTPLDGHNVAKRFLKDAGKAIGCPWVSWHCLRHTAATRTDQFLTSAQKQALLGHASAAMSGRYTHPQVEDLRAGMEKASERVM